jgi:hypothetical protein
MYRRSLQTNEPVNDRAIPTDVEVSVIAAIGPLNSRKEANAHATPDRTAGKSIYVRFEVFKAVTMKNGIFWDVTPCGSCKNRRFGGT